MNQVAKIDEEREVSPQQQFRDELTRMGDQFVAALPEHIKPERFQRIVLTAVLGDPQLLRADRKSLLEAAMRAAQDGLLPDKREGAFVVFNTKVKVNGKDQWINAVQWMPMIGGIIKKMHQSGEIAMITAKVVYGGDTFRAWVDDDGEHVAYEQAEHPDYDTIRQVFALARTKDGSVYVETLTPRDIDKIRSVSRSKDRGPWVTWWEEMAKKSAIRRLAKRLPLSAEIHDLIQRDNDLYDLSRAPDPQPSLRDRLTSGRQQVAIEHQEGFSHPSYASEHEIVSGDEEDEQDSSVSPTDDSAAASDTASQPQEDAAATLSAADTGGDEEAGAAVPVEKAAYGEPSVPAPELDWLKTFARAMVASIGPDEAVVVNQSKGLFVEGLSEDTRAKARSVTNYCRACSRGEIELSDCLDMVAGVVGCEVRELR